MFFSVCIAFVKVSYAQLNSTPEKYIGKQEWFNQFTVRNAKDIENVRKPVWEMIYKWDEWQHLHGKPRLLLGCSVIGLLQKRKIAIPVMVLTDEFDQMNPNKLLDLYPQQNRLFCLRPGMLVILKTPKVLIKLFLKFFNGKTQ